MPGRVWLWEPRGRIAEGAAGQREKRAQPGCDRPWGKSFHPFLQTPFQCLELSQMNPTAPRAPAAWREADAGSQAWDIAHLPVPSSPRDTPAEWVLPDRPHGEWE